MVRETFKQLGVGVIGGLIPAYLFAFLPPDEVKASAKSAWEGSKGIVELMGSPVEVPAWYLMLAFLTCFFFFAGLARQVYVWASVWASSRGTKLSAIEESTLTFLKINYGTAYTCEQISAITGAPLLAIESARDKLLERDFLDSQMIMGTGFAYTLSAAGRAYALQH